MPKRSEKNLYPGINPHLNSYLQQDGGGWESFHAEYIGELRRVLDKVLPPGYLAISERSLQIRETTSTEKPAGRTRPNILVYQTGVSASSLATAPIANPTVTLQLADLIDEEKFLISVVVYQVGENAPGPPVTRFEILSPANKLGGSHHSRYIDRRWETLQQGLCLIEVDFLHETPPILSALPSYPDDEPNAYPYSIIVSDPRPALPQGQSKVYGFGLDDPIPKIAIPLANEDSCVLDFGQVYHQMFENWRFALATVDYEQEPVNFE